MTTDHDLTTKTVPLDSLTPHPHNPRNGDTDAIADSIATNGLYKPLVVARGIILAGNHTAAAAAQLGITNINVIDLDIDPLGEQATRILLTDNRTSDLAEYDDALLAGALHELETLEGTGYTPGDLEALDASLAALAASEGDPAATEDEREPETGELLDIADVAVGEPEAKVSKGDVWRLGTHWLVCMSPHTDWPQWDQYLTEGTVLLPYPDPFVVCGTLAAEAPLLLIQPNTYLAGHTVDKWNALHKQDKAVKL